MHFYVRIFKASLLRFTGSIPNVFKVPGHTKCISLNNQPCISRLTLTNLNLDEYSQGLCYYILLAKIYKCNGSCNTLDNI